MGFLTEIETLRDEGLRALAGAGDDGGAAGAASGEDLLRVALANEISVSELAASYVPLCPEPDVKIAFARQAGDEARHYELLRGRLRAHGLPADPPPPAGPNALFDYLRGLRTSVERVAGTLFTLEAIARAVNDRFMALCETRGDRDTLALYREFIQPDEDEHARLGSALLERHARDEAGRAAARAVVRETLRLAAEQRDRAAARLKTRSFPGC